MVRDALSSSPRFVYCCVARGDSLASSFTKTRRTLERVSRTCSRRRGLLEENEKLLLVPHVAQVWGSLQVSRRLLGRARARGWRAPMSAGVHPLRY